MRYQIELSETALGYSKVTDLLQDFRLHDLCSVQLQGRGYAVVEVMGGDVAPMCDNVQDMVQPALFQRVVFCPDAPLCLEEAGPLAMPASEQKQEQSIAVLSPSMLARDGLVGCMVRDTFIHFPQHVGSARQRSLSVPKDFGSHRDPWETECHSLAFFPRRLDGDEGASVSHQSIDTPLSSPLTASGVRHADMPLLALDWGERCLSLGLVPWPVHLMSSQAMLTVPGYTMPQFIPGSDVEPCVQWCWPPLDKSCDNSSSAWSTCADSAECDAMSVPGTPSMASRLRRHELSQSQANRNTSASNGSTPRSIQGKEILLAELTTSQQHLMHLRASGQATLSVLAGEFASSSPHHTNQSESGWSGLHQWCNENSVACHQIDVSGGHSIWRSCGDTRQDAFAVHSGLQASMHWD